MAYINSDVLKEQHPGDISLFPKNGRRKALQRNVWFRNKLSEEVIAGEGRCALLDLIKSCRKRKDLQRARRIHSDAFRNEHFRKDIYIRNCLIMMYTNCGALREAHELFDDFPVRTIVSWNALIIGYVQQGFNHDAINFFRQMQEQGLLPNIITLSSILKACGGIGHFRIGEQLHVVVSMPGMLENCVVVGTALVDMYAKCGMLEKSEELLAGLQSRNVVSWSALIAGYVQHGLGNEALRCFEQMKNECVPPDAVIFISVLKACSSVGSLEMGKEIHAEVRKYGFLEKNVALGNALLDMYVKCGALSKAKVVFEDLPVRNVVSWSTLISGYAEQGLGDEALHCFRRMQDEGLTPNVITFTCILKACSRIGCLQIGEEIHAEVNKQGLLKKDVLLGTALVDMYAKCGALQKAQDVFEILPVRDVVAWTALIAGYAQQGHGDEALVLYRQMQDEGFFPNEITFTCILKACGSIGSLKVGEEIHIEVKKTGLLRKNMVIGGALVDMYAKCSMMEKAQEVFDELPIQNIVSWNALISGYSQLGNVEAVFICFKKLTKDTIPNLITFLVLLNACNHAGLVEEGQMYFDEMISIYCLVPTLEHYSCVVDLFCRGGYFNKALIVIEMVNPADRLPLWLALLGACCKWVNVEMGRWAFEQSICLDKNCVAAYNSMGNLYAAAGMHEEADNIYSLGMRNKSMTTSSSLKL